MPCCVGRVTWIGDDRPTHQLHQGSLRLIDRRDFLCVLGQKLSQRLAHRDRRINARIATGTVGTDRNQVGMMTILTQMTPCFAGCIGKLWTDQVRLQSTETGKHIDGRPVRFGRQVATEHDVSVKQAAERISDRFIVVIALDQHGVEGSDRSSACPPGTFDEPRKHVEHAWWVPSRRRRFARGKSKFSLGHGESSYRVK